MAIIWNPRSTLGLPPDNQEEWHCIGVDSSGDDEHLTSTCGRTIHPLDLDRVHVILSVIARQMPDEVEHEILLDLARACLCTEHPGAHRGDQDAVIIYKWTELLSAEASEIRGDVRPYVTEAVPGLPAIQYSAQAFTTSLNAGPSTSLPLLPHRKTSDLWSQKELSSRASQPRLNTRLSQSMGHTFPTPIAMHLPETHHVQHMIDRWETETITCASPMSLVPSPTSPTPFRLVETTAEAMAPVLGKDIASATPPRNGQTGLLDVHANIIYDQSSRLSSASSPSPSAEFSSDSRPMSASEFPRPPDEPQSCNTLLLKIKEQTDALDKQISQLKEKVAATRRSQERMQRLLRLLIALLAIQVAVFLGTSSRR